MRIRDILQTKGTTVITVAPETAIQEALRLLVSHNIGALVVFDDSIRGVITERDVLRAAAKDMQRLGEARVQDVMTSAVITADPEADIREVMEIMTERRIRHLPVVEKGGLCGMISIGDVVSALRQSVESENRYLHAYIDGTPL
jgi:CBS domain-containing protein